MFTGPRGSAPWSATLKETRALHPAFYSQPIRQASPSRSATSSWGASCASRFRGVFDEGPRSGGGGRGQETRDLRLDFSRPASPRAVLRAMWWWSSREPVATSAPPTSPCRQPPRAAAPDLHPPTSPGRRPSSRSISRGRGPSSARADLPLTQRFRMETVLTGAILRARSSEYARDAFLPLTSGDVTGRAFPLRRVRGYRSSASPGQHTAR